MADRERFETALRSAAEALTLTLKPAQVAQMWAHFVRVLETNQQFNLTGITDPQAAAVKLYADALAPLAWTRTANVPVRTCLDVGTGAGFPAVPLAIVRPAWRIRAIDSTGKKARFVAACAAEMPLSNLTAAHERAGEGGKGRERFDLLLFKAVGPLAKCIQCTRNRVAANGHAIVFKGPSLSRAEIDDGERAGEAMHLQTWDVFDYELPCGSETLEHSLVIYRRMR